MVKPGFGLGSKLQINLRMLKIKVILKMYLLFCPCKIQLNDTAMLNIPSPCVVFMHLCIDSKTQHKWHHQSEQNTVMALSY